MSYAVTEKYKTSIHWKKSGGRKIWAASCIDCHSVHNIIPSTDQTSPTHLENIPLMCGGCHENQTKMQAWLLWNKDRQIWHLQEVVSLQVIPGWRKCTCKHVLTAMRIMIQNRRWSWVCIICEPAQNLWKNKLSIQALNNVYVYGGKIHEEQSVNLLFIDVKSLVNTSTYYDTVWTGIYLRLIFLGITSGLDIKGRKNHEWIKIQTIHA